MVDTGWTSWSTVGADQLRKKLGTEKEIVQPTLVEVDNGGSYLLK
jgi:hypothetical protein